jgi:hypothetical protein
MPHGPVREIRIQRRSYAVYPGARYSNYNRNAVLPNAVLP